MKLIALLGSRQKLARPAREGNKDWVVYISPDAERTLREYLSSQSSSKEKEIFLVNHSVDCCFGRAAIRL